MSSETTHLLKPHHKGGSPAPDSGGVSDPGLKP